MSDPLFEFFASKSVAAHLLRGVGAAGLLTYAFKIGAEDPLLSVAAGLGALVLLRGCPMCWIIGLIETIRRAFRE
jgi:hypothetical protein